LSDAGYSVFVGISHPSMPPYEITATLQLEPEHAHIAGQQRVSPKGEHREGVYPENYWGRVMFEGDMPQPPLSEALTEVMQRFSGHKEFFQKICADGGHIDLRIFWTLDEGVGDFFSANLIRQIADFGMDISLTIYP